MKSLPFRKLVDVAGKPGDPEHSAWLHILRDKKISLKKQWHGYGTTAEFQRILVRQDDLCLAQTIASAVRHIGGVIGLRKQQGLSVRQHPANTSGTAPASQFQKPAPWPRVRIAVNQRNPNFFNGLKPQFSPKRTN